MKKRDYRLLIILAFAVFNCSGREDKNFPVRLVYKPRQVFLEDRILNAQFVGSCSVLSVKPANELFQFRKLGANNPDWYWAHLRVRAVLRGYPRDSSVLILFPKNSTGLWQNMPKFTGGEKGICLLHSEKIYRYITNSDNEDTFFPQVNNSNLNDVYISVLTAFDPLDFLPLDSLSRVQKLVLRLADSVSVDSITRQ